MEKPRYRWISPEAEKAHAACIEMARSVIDRKTARANETATAMREREQSERHLEAAVRPYLDMAADIFAKYTSPIIFISADQAGKLNLECIAPEDFYARSHETP